MTVFKHLLVVVVGALLLTCTAMAQINRGELTGIVTDQSGAVVPGVAVIVTNGATGVANNLKTNTSGVFTVPMLEPGTYNLVAEKEGFKKYSRTNIVVPVGETVRVDVALTIGSRTETVEVTAQATLLERGFFDTATNIT